MISSEKPAPTSRPKRSSWNWRYLAIIYCHATYSVSGTKLSTRNTAAILWSSDIFFAKRSLSWSGSYRKRNAATPNLWHNLYASLREIPHHYYPSTFWLSWLTSSWTFSVSPRICGIVSSLGRDNLPPYPCLFTDHNSIPIQFTNPWVCY